MRKSYNLKQMKSVKNPHFKKLHWYDQCAVHALAYKGLESNHINDAHELVNQICRVLEKNGFMDSDWWCEGLEDWPGKDLTYYGRPS